MSSKKHKKLKLLLDEGLPPKQAYPLITNYHNTVHIAHDLKKGGASDISVYKIANNQGRLPIVFNAKDFLPLIKPDTLSVISLSANLANKQADNKIFKSLKSLTPSKLKGHLILISNQGTNIKKIIEK